MTETNRRKREILTSLFSGDPAPLRKFSEDHQKDIYSITGFYSQDSNTYKLQVNRMDGGKEHMDDVSEEELKVLTARTRSVQWNKSPVPFVIMFNSIEVEPYTSEREVIEKFGLDSDPYGPLE